MLCVEWMMVKIESSSSLSCSTVWMHSFLEYSETLARMPRWKKILFTVLCIGTCCCFGGGCCCLCGFGCCCNFCCNHCCGKYKTDDAFSPFPVSNRLWSDHWNALDCSRTTKILLVSILKRTSMQQWLQWVHEKRIPSSAQIMSIRECLYLLRTSRRQRPTSNGNEDHSNVFE